MGPNCDPCAGGLLKVTAKEKRFWYIKVSLYEKLKWSNFLNLLLTHQQKILLNLKKK
jgi:hypothetical protein